MKLAIFDLDNTLLGGDSDHEWGEFLIRAELVDAEQHRQQNNAFYAQYQAGNLDIEAYVAFAAMPIAGRPAQELQALHQRFMTESIQTMMLPKARTLLDSHRAAGDYLLIITATNRFITGPIAQQLGVDTLLATELEQRDGYYTGRMQGVPCFQQGKVTRLQQWLEAHNASNSPALDMGNSIFYSDSFNDLPLLEQAAEAVAVDPDNTLRAEALRRGWPVISLRD
jgi:HAD superfamily hydrolase (TIGR01490 family)